MKCFVFAHFSISVITSQHKDHCTLVVCLPYSVHTALSLHWLSHILWSIVRRIMYRCIISLFSTCTCNSVVLPLTRNLFFIKPPSHGTGM